MRIGKILDVVEAPDVIGKAMHALGTTPVPHIVVPDGDTVHWLLPRGAANRRPWPWARISRYVKVLPNVAEFGVPGPASPTGSARTGRTRTDGTAATSLMNGSRKTSPSAPSRTSGRPRSAASCAPSPCGPRTGFVSFARAAPFGIPPVTPSACTRSAPERRA